MGNITYIGLLSVPWVKVDGTTWDVPSQMTSVTGFPQVVNHGNSNYDVVFEYTWTGTVSGRSVSNFLEIDYFLRDDFHKNSSVSKITCRVYHLLPYDNLWYDLEVPWRVDYDISGASSDIQWDYSPGSPILQKNEKTMAGFAGGGVYGLNVIQLDNNTVGPWAGICPTSPTPTSHNLYFLKYNSGEFKGDPSNYYRNLEDIYGKDDLFWDIGGPVTVYTSGTMDIDLWLY